MIVQFPDVDRVRRDRSPHHTSARHAVSAVAIRAGTDSRGSTDHPRRNGEDLSGGMSDAARQRVRALTEAEASRRPMGESAAREIAAELKHAIALRPELLGSVVAYLSPTAGERLSL